MSETQEEVKPDGLLDPSEVFAAEPAKEETIEELIEQLPDGIRQLAKIQKKATMDFVPFKRPELEFKAICFDWRMPENMVDVLNQHFVEGWMAHNGMTGQMVWQYEPTSKILFILSREREPEVKQ